MAEQLAPMPAGPLVTQADIVRDLRALGVVPGMTLLVHSSLSKIGWVAGAQVAVILALEEVLTPEGTLVMPTHTGDLSDPANWRNPPVLESWWEPIRQNWPAYSPDITPTHGMGVIPETFRKQSGVVRSNHPHTSFSAWGKHAATIVADHPLTPAFGDDSPLGRIYALEGWVLLLGVGHGNNTSLHLAEYRADVPRTYEESGSPMFVNGARQWAPWRDIAWSDEDFVELGAAFASATGLQREARIGAANTLLTPQRPLVDFAVPWLEKNRAKGLGPRAKG